MYMYSEMKDFLLGKSGLSTQVVSHGSGLVKTGFTVLHGVHKIYLNNCRGQFQYYSSYSSTSEDNHRYVT